MAKLPPAAAGPDGYHCFCYTGTTGLLQDGLYWDHVHREDILRTPRTMPATMRAVPASAALLSPARLTSASPLPSSRCRFGLQCSLHKDIAVAAQGNITI